MTVSFYASTDTSRLFLLRDYGDGIACKILKFEGHWIKIEMTTGQVGYVNLDEPLSTSTVVH